MAENVKDLLKEMKNISSLMLDLAYSSLFFRSKDIAEEVVLLYRQLEDTEEKLYMHLFAASRGKPAARLISVIDIVEAAKDVAIASKHMSEMVLENSQLHPVIHDAIAESDESIARATIGKKSILANKILGELRLRTDIGFDILAIRRGKRWLWNPGKKTLLKKSDMIIGIGPKEGCHKFEKLASGAAKV